jgi:hypothetical protein
MEAAWIEAIATALLALFTLITLIVLCVYAWDTKTIARASVEQGENAQMPLISLTHAQSSTEYSLENQGFGPAMNVHGYAFDLVGEKHDFTRENIAKDCSGTQAIYVSTAIKKCSL